MSRTLSCLLCGLAVCLANPVMEIAFSEIQTAPDSLERLELHWYSGGGYEDLSGCLITTNAGSAVIDSGVMLVGDDYLVIDRTNTTGTFSLGDDSDHVELWVPGRMPFELDYPANPFRYAYDRSWAPPPGKSSAMFQWWEFEYPGEWVDYYTWYIDDTPTFGARNDDTLGGISGYIRDDRGQRLNGATVRISAAQGTAQMTSGQVSYWPAGYFEEKPTGPGTFMVTAECPGHVPGAYPDSIVLAPNELREIDIFLNRVGVVEENRSDPAPRIRVTAAGRSLLVHSDRAATATLAVYDPSGRLRLSRMVTLTAGSNRIALAPLRSGAYFVRLNGGINRERTKVVIY